MITNPFKYGRIFDSTIVRLVLALMVLLPWTISFCSRQATEPRRSRHAVIATGQLLTDSLAALPVTVQRGDTVTLLGLVDKSDANRPLFWVETNGGARGFLPQECLADSAFVVSSSLNFSKDTVHYSATHAGDTIVVKKIGLDKNKIAQSTVRLASGKDTLLRNTPFVFFLADTLTDYTVERDGSNRAVMSLAAFEKRCVGRRLADVEADLLPAQLLAPARGGGLEAQFQVLVFNSDDGAFYCPIVTFGPDSVATGYRMPARPMRTMNSWVLKYLPFYGTLCDLPMVGAIWCNGPYSYTVSPISQSRIDRFNLNGFSMDTVGYFAVFLLLIVLLIAHATLMPLLVPWLIYGLLRFPPVFKFLGNRAMYHIIKWTTLLLAVGWVLATLSNYYIILTVIGEVLVVGHFLTKADDLLSASCPEQRCSACKTLYSCEFTERVQEGPSHDAVEEVEETLDRVVTSVEQWQTYDEVTTTYGDGHKETHKENIKNHSAEHGYYIIGVFREEVRYVPYTNYFTCAECGAQETSHDEDRNVLRRTKLREYRSSF